MQCREAVMAKIPSSVSVDTPTDRFLKLAPKPESPLGVSPRQPEVLLLLVRVRWEPNQQIVEKPTGR